ncbi:DUF58 domain-containing protein [Nocardioides panacisoli]|uniref:DUF58 domain-containing protein n=1 Tax=Nocardioides panacisoli TaxID=627624 RepID=UPI001C6286AE|nr:DUF58 domain-containing protein [Nocardioides panacisoli]QYJ04053.1 DUF58 domain-containing protein [Nocardioides panacisoli]
MSSHLTRVKTHLSLHAHRKVRGMLEGEYASVQVGRGIDFSDLRSYVRGDDVKDIDWKASARTRQLLVKRYVAERKHTILLTVSTGRSMAALNDVDVSKRDLAVFAAGLVGYLAAKHADLVGLVHGDAAEQHVRRAAGGEVHLERLLATVHDATSPTGAASDLGAVLDYVRRAVRRRTIMVVVSDETALSEEVVQLLRRLRVQHEILYLTIGDLDPTAAALPVGAGSGPMVDVDTGREVPEWLRGDARLQQEYAALVATEESTMRRQLDRLGIVHERIHDRDTAVTAVFRLLERHRHARHG